MNTKKIAFAKLFDKLNKPAKTNNYVFVSFGRYENNQRFIAISIRVKNSYIDLTDLPLDEFKLNECSIASAEFDDNLPGYDFEIVENDIDNYMKTVGLNQIRFSYSFIAAHENEAEKLYNKFNRKGK